MAWLAKVGGSILLFISTSLGFSGPLPVNSKLPEPAPAAQATVPVQETNAEVQGTTQAQSTTSASSTAPASSAAPPTKPKPVVVSSKGTWSDWRWYPLGTHFGTGEDFYSEYYQSYRDMAGKVYFIPGDALEFTEMKGVDRATFQFAFSENSGVGLNWAKDATRVYWKSSALSGADPATFVPIFDANGSLTFFGKDKNHVYFQDKLILSSDPKTFVVPVSGTGPYNTSLSANDASTQYSDGTKSTSNNFSGSSNSALEQRNMPIQLITAANTYVTSKLGKSYVDTNLIYSVRDSRYFDPSGDYLIAFIDSGIEEQLAPLKEVKYYITVDANGVVDEKGTLQNNKIPDCVSTPALCAYKISQRQAEDIAVAASGLPRSSMLAADITLRAGSVTLSPNTTCNQGKSVTGVDGWFWMIEFTPAKGLKVVEVNAATGAVNVCTNVWS
jgi:hypothetical protein